MPLGLVNSTDPAIENSFHGRDRRGVGRGWPPSAALKVRPDGNVNNQGLHLAMPVYRVDHDGATARADCWPRFANA